jgi:hypothetical protein
MKTRIRYAAPLLGALAVSGTLLVAPIAGTFAPPASGVTVAAPQTPGGAGTDPLVPFGTNPQVPQRLGYIDSNHDEANTTNGEVDLPF